MKPYASCGVVRRCRLEGWPLGEDRKIYNFHTLRFDKPVLAQVDDAWSMLTIGLTSMLLLQ